MAKKIKKSLQEAVSNEIKKNFDLGSFKEKKGLKQNVKFKEQEWIPLSRAFQDVTSIPGIEVLPKTLNKEALLPQSFQSFS